MPSISTKKAKSSKAGPSVSKRKSAEAKDEGSASSEEVEDVEASDVEDRNDRVLKKTWVPPDDSHLPPITTIPHMFDDLVERAEAIEEVAKRVQGRKLRVATMCSGTESPLLALNLIFESIQKHYGMKLEFHHVFSCEIEPFKQAYIERNFSPPLLFRDVCELGDDKAHTAYGSLEPVPGDVDILIAGTSCVDYSNLNNEKQDIDANGESGRTFRGMMGWVKRHRPPIVLLENVIGAPWDKVADYFDDNGYDATHIRMDTKTFYIPHTRQRKYLFAVNRKGGVKTTKFPAAWMDLLKKLQRDASASLDAFLLPSDDPWIHQARQKLVEESYNAADRRTGRTDWARCESRHQRCRLEEQLGSKRPLTGWEEGGSCKVPDFAWSDWAVGQVERVWDLLDISLLRSAKKGIDPSYKTDVWNLSQNVDRSQGSGKTGICPCLTPSMIPYITNRGGPMVGLEALSMQGLPIDQLLLTRESEDQLADLAGNAMSTTVVGACILAALIVSRELLKGGDETRSYESLNGKKKDEAVEDDAMEIDIQTAVESQAEIVGQDALIEQPLQLGVKKATAVAELLEAARTSTRMCLCEGRTDVTEHALLRCLDCGTSTCVKCGGRPEHNTEPIDTVSQPRQHPSHFLDVLKSSLAMTVLITGLTEESLEQLKGSAGIDIPDGKWKPWLAAVIRAVDSQLRFTEVRRQEVWSVVYTSPTATLILFLYPIQPEWQLFAKAQPSDPANAEIRRLLHVPVARCRCSQDLLSGKWELGLPYSDTFDIEIKGAGELVPSWSSRLGIVDPEHAESKVHAELEVSLPESVSALDRDISGTYKLLPRCGTANSALHKRVQDPTDKLAPLYLLLDPHRTNSSQDSFVFSSTIKRCEYQEYRPIVCKVKSSWRQSDTESETVKCEIPCHWIAGEDMKLTTPRADGAVFAVPGSNLKVAFSADSCKAPTAILSCKVPLSSDAGPEWPRERWLEVDKVHERATFKSLAWILEPTKKSMSSSLSDWNDVPADEVASHCERCAPKAPEVKWISHGRKAIPVENHTQAGQYERGLKTRPSPFVTRLQLNKDHQGVVELAINFSTLTHRAFSRLPSHDRTSPVSLAYRLDTDFVPMMSMRFKKFTILSNKADKEHKQPPSFKIPLRSEQLRSLEWMIAQESVDAEPFIEEEVSEAILEPLGWRAEGRARRPHAVRGGVLADQVGYGKTAITLGLIDCNAKSSNEELNGHKKRLPGKIRVKGTLAIVPPHLTSQWASEVTKFTGKRFKILVISTASKIRTITIEEVRDADIIIVASNLFKSNVYLENLTSFAGCRQLPSAEGRHFHESLLQALEGVRKHTDLLRSKTGGAAAVLKSIKEGQRRCDEEDAALAELAQSKRLKGKKYREAAEAKEDAVESDSEAELDYSPRDWQAKKTDGGQVPEVVINKKKASSSTKSSQASATSATEDDEDDAPVSKRPKRAASKKIIVISDEDEDADDEPAPKKKGTKRAAPKRRAAKASASSGSSDYEDAGDSSDNDSPPESDFVDFDGETSEDEDSAPKKKSKTTAKPAKKPAKSSASTASSADEMDLEKPAKNSKGVKRKANDDLPKQPAKKVRVDQDPWKLGKKATQEDYDEMASPPLEMFHYTRVVVDEYTYLEGKVHSLVTALTSDRHWVLSGTPPIHDFGALKTIAAFLGIHLGIDDDAEGRSSEVKRRKRDQSAAEKFHAFREVRSANWHARRHELGQTFLDHYVRQNIAEIDEIPFSIKLQPVTLPAAERAIYLELEHHLRALDMTIKRGKKSESDREKRLAQSLGDSKTAEEALLKRCSHFDLDTNVNENAVKACDVIVEERQRQLDGCKKELLDSLKKGVAREKEIRRKIPHADQSIFNEHIHVMRTKGAGDKEATRIICDLLDDAGASTSKASKLKDAELTENQKKEIWEHREKTHEIRRLTKELVGRVRSLRYFTAVRDLQKQRDRPPVLTCPGCKREDVSLEEGALLSSCGHSGCLDCVKAAAEKEECVYGGALAECDSAARGINIIKSDTLGVDEAREGKGKRFGMKIEKIIELIQKQIPKKERILLFVQFPDLMKRVAEALGHHKITFLEIKGSAIQKTNNLSKFQEEGSKVRVLLLNVMDESASGANLTVANHAIFLSPLLAPSQEIYDACETQAVGRLVRYGQTENVYIWRYMSTSTIDEEIFEVRDKSMLSRMEED